MPDIVVRVLVIYIFLMVAFRCVGKRELGSLSPFELVTLLLIPEIVSAALSGQTSLTSALTGVSTLFLLVFAFSALAHRFPRIERLLESSPTILVEHGRLCEEAMNRERIAPEEIFAEMHKRGLERIESVRWAILESGGDIAIIAYEQGADRSTPDKRSELIG